MGYPRPTALTGMRAVLYFNAGPSGWTERYFWSGPSGRAGAFEADVAALVAARRMALTEKAAVVGVRLGAWPEANAATRLILRDPFVGVGQVIEDPNGVEGPWLAARVGAFDETRVYRRDYAFRALARKSMRWGGSEAGSLSPEGRAQAADLLRVMGNDTPGGQAGRWCLAADVKDPAVTGRQRILRLAPVPRGCGTLVTTARAPVWKEGDVVKLNWLGQCSPKGMNGPAIVLAVAGLVTTVSQEPWCPTPNYTVGPKSTVELQTQALYAQTTAAVSGITDRRAQPAFRRMTWAPAAQLQPGCCAPVSTGVECLAVHPCGVVMDLLTVAYAARTRTFGGREPSPVVWFDAPAGAAVYEAETVFRSAMYPGDLRAYSGVGEQVRTCWSSRAHAEQLVGRVCESRDGSPPAPYLGKTPCGDAQAWLVGGTPGVTPEIVTDRAGRPPCCLPLSTPGGQRQGGREPLTDAGGGREGGAPHAGPAAQRGGQREGGVPHAGPTRPAGGGSEGGPLPAPAAGGGREGGAPHTGPQRPAGGERAGGTPAPGARTSPGGEREGGTPRPGPAGAAGGGREGGPAPPVGPGGQRQGGRLPRAPRGGQTEGGTPSPGAPSAAGGGREGGPQPLTRGGGQRDGGRPASAPRGGQTEGGRQTAAAGGGQTEGGRAPEAARGGQAQGGASPRLPLGGESEGGPLPPLPFGGESEGGYAVDLPFGGESEGGQIAPVGVSTPCCPNPVARTLTLTLSAPTAFAARYTLNYSDADGYWTTGAFTVGGASCEVRFRCGHDVTGDDSWELAEWCGGVRANVVYAPADNCDPFHFTANPSPWAYGAGCSSFEGVGTATVQE